MSLSKRPRPVPDDVPAPKRLAHNVRDLYASNDISARRAQSLINDMHSANVRHNLAPAMDLDNKNLARTIRTRLLKNSKWPPDYIAKVRVIDRFSGEEQWQDVALLVPHEVLPALLALGTADQLGATVNMDPESLEHLTQCRLESGVADVMGYGIHADGVPHSWDREESAEVVSFSMPGLGGKWANLRIPLLAIPHSSFSENTWDDIVAVFA